MSLFETHKSHPLWARNAFKMLANGRKLQFMHKNTCQVAPHEAGGHFQVLQMNKWKNIWSLKLLKLPLFRGNNAQCINSDSDSTSLQPYHRDPV